MIFYKDITSEDRIYKLVPSLVPSELVISLTSRKYLSRTEMASLDSPLVGFEMQKKSATLQNELKPETDIIPSTLSKTDEDHRITVMEKNKFSNTETECSWKRQKLEQQKSVLVTKDLLQTSNVSKLHMLKEAIK